METGLSFTIWKSETSSNDHNRNDSVKWSSSSSSSSSKIRLVINYNQTETPTKTIDALRNFQDLNPMPPSPSPSDQTNKRNTLNDGGGAIIRTCSDCNTTKTPLWRSGPRGPKVNSLYIYIYIYFCWIAKLNEFLGFVKFGVI